MGPARGFVLLQGRCGCLVEVFTQVLNRAASDVPGQGESQGFCDSAFAVVLSRILDNSLGCFLILQMFWGIIVSIPQVS